MPEVIDVRALEIKDGFNSDEDVIESIERARIFLEDKLEEANSISNEIFKCVALFTIIDSLAMEVNDYTSRNAKEAFTDFVIKYQNKYDFLENIEPVTLYYDYEDKIKDRVLDEELYELYKIPGLKEKEINLNEYGVIDSYTVPEFMKSGLSERLLSLIEKQEGSDNWYKKNHQFINLLYKMRSKAVHELGYLGLEDPVERRDNKRIPYYREVIKSYIEDKQVKTYKIYELVIPNQFIYDLAKNCINNYLDDCKETKRYPYKNNDGVLRKVYLSWNDKRW